MQFLSAAGVGNGRGLTKRPVCSVRFPRHKTAIDIVFARRDKGANRSLVAWQFDFDTRKCFSRTTESAF